MKPLSDIFDVYNAQDLELINCKKSDSGVCFISRTSANNGVSARIERLSDLEPMPAHAITVALGGSVLSTFYQSEKFYTAFHIAILYPKTPLTKSEMLYYCYVIEQNKYRYNYGRQANTTLRNILVPEYHEIPDFVKQADTETDNFFKKTPLSSQKLELHPETWQWFRVGDLFELESCKCSNASEYLEDGNDIAYIGAKKNDNGIMNFVQSNENLTTKGNCIVFIGDGQGSVGYCTYQPKDFIGSTTLTAGFNENLNPYNAQFLITILDFERYRYSFGRKYKQNVVARSRILLPARPDGTPDWQFMENYIKGLPYSGCL